MSNMKAYTIAKSRGSVICVRGRLTLVPSIGRCGRPLVAALVVVVVTIGSCGEAAIVPREYSFNTKYVMMMMIWA